jgi:hypothetical protein
MRFVGLWRLRTLIRLQLNLVIFQISQEMAFESYSIVTPIHAVFVCFGFVQKVIGQSTTF